MSGRVGNSIRWCYVPGSVWGTGSKYAISYSKDRRIQCFQTVTKAVIPAFGDWRLTSRRTENIGLKDKQILLE